MFKRQKTPFYRRSVIESYDIIREKVKMPKNVVMEPSGTTQTTCVLSKHVGRKLA